MNTQPILSEDHTQDQFFDKLEELCDCKGEGYIKALEKIVEMKKQISDALGLLHESEAVLKTRKMLHNAIKSENEELKERIKSIRIEAEEMNAGGWKIIMENEKLKNELKEIVNGVESGSNEEVRINKILHPEAFEDSDED